MFADWTGCVALEPTIDTFGVELRMQTRKGSPHITSLEVLHAYNAFAAVIGQIVRIGHGRRRERGLGFSHFFSFDKAVADDNWTRRIVNNLTLEQDLCSINNYESHDIYQHIQYWNREHNLFRKLYGLPCFSSMAYLDGCGQQGQDTLPSSPTQS